MKIGCWAYFLALALAASACEKEKSRPAQTPQPAVSAIEVNWADPGLHLDLPQGWLLYRCEGPSVTVCVSKDGGSVGTIRFRDLPSQGQEATTSAEQVQAVLAVRIHTIYKELKAEREEHCGNAYRLDAATPRVVAVAGKPGLKYAAEGIVDGRVRERLVGYRMFRNPIESQIEAKAAESNACGADHQSFSVSVLRSFEPFLDRLVAGSTLPAPTRFTPAPSAVGAQRPQPASNLMVTSGNT